jgi:hypothetical protein
MRIELTEAEICRAVEKYLRGKNASDHPSHEYTVRILWRGEPPRAIVDIKPAIPTLTEVLDARVA